MEGLQLDADLFSTEQNSYTIQTAGKELAMRAFLFQQDGLFSCDGRRLGTVTRDDVDWSSATPCGKGASGTVFYATLKKTPSGENNVKGSIPVAIKKISIGSKSHRDEVERELTILLNARAAEGPESRHSLRTYGAFWDPDESVISIIMEWMMYSAADVAGFSGGLSEDCVRALVFQLVSGLHYLHNTLKVIHRDLKPSNLLINREGVVKIGDFGVSKVVQTLNFSSTYIGTMMFMAPERLEEGGYSYPSDVWSVGLIVISLATGKANPFAPPDEISLFQLLQKITGGNLPTLPDGFSNDAKDFVSRCLMREPEKRATTAELLEHPFLKNCTDESAQKMTQQTISFMSKLLQSATKKATGK